MSDKDDKTLLEYRLDTMEGLIYETWTTVNKLSHCVDQEKFYRWIVPVATGEIVIYTLLFWYISQGGI